MLRVWENRVVKGMFEPKREEVTGDWRQLHNEQLCVLYYSPNDIGVLTVFIAQHIVQLDSKTADMCRPSTGRENTALTDHVKDVQLHSTANVKIV